jgi:hypothetical protein
MQPDRGRAAYAGRPPAFIMTGNVTLLPQGET